MKTKRSTFKVLFYVKRTAARVSDGKAPVMARITIDGDIATFSAKLFVTPSLWNAEAGKVNGKSAEAVEINPQLEEIKARIDNHYYQILRADDFVTSEKVRNAFLGIGVMENCILKDFQTMNKEFGDMVEKKLRAKSTYNKYLTVYKHLEAFMWEKKKRTDMAYKELTKDFIDDFDSYLRNEKGLSANTLWIYTMPVLSLTDKAWRRGIIRTDPFSEYKLEMEETDRGYLTEEELQAVANTVFVDKQTNLVRDMFLFSCFTGIPYGDMRLLTKDNLCLAEDGIWWIKSARQKTKIEFEIPLLDLPLQILKKYSGTAPGDKLLPMYCNSTLNLYLKEIARICHIDRPLVFHAGRHTYATEITLSHGVPLETVSRMLGHSQIETTQIYAKVTDEKIDADTKALNRKISERFSVVI